MSVCGVRSVCAVVDWGCVCCELHPESPQDTQPSGHSRPKHPHSKRLTRSPQSTQPSGQQTLAHCTQQAHNAQRTHSLRNTRGPQRTQPYPLHTLTAHRAHSSLWTVCSVVCDAGHSFCRGEIFMRSSKRAEAFMKALGNLHGDGKPSSKLQGSFMKRRSRQESSGELSYKAYMKAFAFM